MDWSHWRSWPRPWWLPAPTTWVAVGRVVARAVEASASKVVVVAVEKWAAALVAVLEKWVGALVVVAERWGEAHPVVA